MLVESSCVSLDFNCNTKGWNIMAVGLKTTRNPNFQAALALLEAALHSQYGIVVGVTDCKAVMNWMYKVRDSDVSYSRITISPSRIDPERELWLLKLPKLAPTPTPTLAPSLAPTSTPEETPDVPSD